MAFRWGATPAAHPILSAGLPLALAEALLGAQHRGHDMQGNLVQPLIALLSGIAILIWPRLLNYIVAIYLILTGLFGLGFRLRGG